MISLKQFFIYVTSDFFQIRPAKMSTQKANVIQANIFAVLKLTKHAKRVITRATLFP